MVRAMHEHGVDHPDLTAHNILLDARGRLFLVDFDNAHLKPPGPWRRAGVERLKRSLRKVAARDRHRVRPGRVGARSRPATPSLPGSSRRPPARQ